MPGVCVGGFFGGKKFETLGESWPGRGLADSVRKQLVRSSHLSTLGVVRSFRRFQEMMSETNDLDDGFEAALAGGPGTEDGHGSVEMWAPGGMMDSNVVEFHETVVDCREGGHDALRNGSTPTPTQRPRETRGAVPSRCRLAGGESAWRVGPILGEALQDIGDFANFARVVGRRRKDRRPSIFSPERSSSWCDPRSWPLHICKKVRHTHGHSRGWPTPLR